MKQWTKSFAPTDVDRNRDCYKVRAGVQLEARLPVDLDPISVLGELCITTDVPHEAMAQLPRLRDIRVVMRFNEEDE